jgi:hypothetical protein
MPLGNEAGPGAKIAGFLGARLANVRPAQLLPLLEQDGAIRLFIGKRLAARFAGVRAGLNVPLVHGRENLTTNALHGHEEILRCKPGNRGRR